MRAFCGMSDERPHMRIPRVLGAWVDGTSKIVLVEVGHVYASCMCPPDVAHLVVSLDRP
jgi:hypothetical protein